MKKQIPNLVTLCNLLFGCLAIVSTLQNGLILQYGDDGAQFLNISEELWRASVFIFLAAVVDYADGFVARLFKAESPMGAQLDSLADVVSFGVAPSLIVYQFLRLSFASEADGLNISQAFLLPAFIIAIAGAYRLARYNVNTSNKPGFEGLPIPAAGLLIASLPLIYWTNTYEWLNEILLNKWFLYFIIISISFLMVSTIPMLSLKVKNLSIKGNLPVIILAAFSVISILLFQWVSVPLIFVAYILLSLFFKKTIHDVYSTN